MVLNTQPTEQKNYRSSITPFKAKGWNWKWEKKHWLLVISVVSLSLWLFSFRAKVKQSSWIQSSLEHLPLLGGLVLVSEQLLRLIS